LTIKCLDLMRSAVPCSRKTCRAYHLYLQPIFNCQRTNDREDRRWTQSQRCVHR
jgi:hypothetical protein